MFYVIASAWLLGTLVTVPISCFVHTMQHKEYTGHAVKFKTCMRMVFAISIAPVVLVAIAKGILESI